MPAAVVRAAPIPAGPYPAQVRATRPDGVGGVTLAAAALAFVLAAVSDLTAGESPLHAVTLASVVAAVVAVRVLVAGHLRRMLQLATAILTVQPALHAAAKIVPHGALSHGSHDAIGGADLAVAGLQIVLAAVVVAALCLTEQLVAVICTVVRVCWLVLRVPANPERDDVGRPDPAPARRWVVFVEQVIARRGPPRVVATG